MTINISDSSSFICAVKRLTVVYSLFSYSICILSVLNMFTCFYSLRYTSQHDTLCTHAYTDTHIHGTCLCPKMHANSTQPTHAEQDTTRHNTRSSSTLTAQEALLCHRVSVHGYRHNSVHLTHSQSSAHHMTKGC